MSTGQQGPGRFYEPVPIGHTAKVRARLARTGRTSMHVAVDVNAGDPKDGRYTNTTRCMIVFVVVDEAGKPVEATRWRPPTEGNVALERYAERISEFRKAVAREESLREGVPG